MLLVYGSKDSLFPRICAVEAVGIGATSKLFLNPYLDKNTQFLELFSLLLQLANFKISEKNNVVSTACVMIFAAFK